jgi:hypothetical protein
MPRPFNPTCTITTRRGGRAGDICSDLIKEIIHSLTPAEPEWRVAVSDEAGKTLYRFRLIAETHHD